MPHCWNVTGALLADLAAGLVAGPTVVTYRNGLRVAVDDQVGVVTGEYQLSMVLAAQIHDTTSKNNLTVEIFLRAGR